MINLKKTESQKIKKIINSIKKNNRKNWLEKLREILESKDYSTEKTRTCSRNHFSGKITERKTKIFIYSYGTQVQARSGFTYNIYPVLIVTKKGA